MKRILALLLIISLIPLGVFSVFAENTKLSRIYLDNTGLKFEEQLVDSDGTWFAPMQKFASQLGVEVSWSFETETATLRKDLQVLQISAISENAVLNGETIVISQPMLKVNSILYVPVRFVAETFNYDVFWDAEREVVEITTPKEITDIGHYYDIVGVTASGNDGNVEANVIDNDYYTRWSCEPTGSYVTLELAEVSPVAYIGIACYNGDVRQTTISVEISEDGKDFKEVVGKTQTSVMLNMEPIDLGGVYNAKYIRVLGYGNTMNNWNSITELKVYAPYEDGSMPVDQGGPDGQTNKNMGELPEEHVAFLNEMDELFSRIYIWLANLYDPETGGFYMAMSGKDDPDQEPGLEMTAYALGNIASYSDMWVTMPDSLRQKFLDFFNDRQDKASGYYIDRQGPANDRETARIQAASTTAVVTRLKGETRYPHPKYMETSKDSTDTTVMPEYMADVTTYMNWVKSWDWDNNSWTGGDQAQQSIVYLNLLDQEKYEEYRRALLNWLAERQEKCGNGLYSPTINFNSVSGLFKVGLIYSSLKEKLPNADLALESIATCFKVDKPDVAHYVRNPLSVMSQISGYGASYAEKVREIVLENKDVMLEYIKMFLCPDGGFSMNYQKSMASFGGIKGSHSLWEGDVDSTAMILISRNVIYQIFGIKAPLLHQDNFWEMLTGEVELPGPYSPEYQEIIDRVGGGGKQDFEGFEQGPVPANQSVTLSGSSALKMEVVKDPDRQNNKVLFLSYDGSQSSGPTTTIKVGGNDAQIKYKQMDTIRKVAEFDIRISNCSSANNFFVNFGGDSYMMNFGGSGMQNLGSRVSPSVTSRSGNYTSINPNEWYHITMEYKQGFSEEDTEIKIYIDGELVTTTRDYYGVADGLKPTSFKDTFNIVWYRAGKGNIYIDNFNIYAKESV